MRLMATSGWRLDPYEGSGWLGDGQSGAGGECSPRPLFSVGRMLGGVGNTSEATVNHQDLLAWQFIRETQVPLDGLNWAQLCIQDPRRVVLILACSNDSMVVSTQLRAVSTYFGVPVSGGLGDPFVFWNHDHGVITQLGWFGQGIGPTTATVIEVLMERSPPCQNKRSNGYAQSPGSRLWLPADTQSLGSGGDDLNPIVSGSIGPQGNHPLPNVLESLLSRLR